MRFLLVAVNAKYIHSNPALYSLRAYAGEELQSQMHLEIAEYTVNQPMEDILADLYRREPDGIGFSCYIWNWDMIRGLLGELPKILPRADLWLGGPEVSFDAPRVLERFPMVRGIMIGEGEAVFRDLLRWYVDGAGKEGQTGLEGIPGLCLPSGFTPARELIDMSSLPFLYRDEEDLEHFRNRIVYYESSRGCPYRCAYCLSSIDKTVRLRDRDIVKRELQFFLDRRVRQVKFVDRTFNCDHDHAMAIWQYLKEHDNGVTNFHFEISADILREDEIALLHQLRPGQVQLEIGVQSTNPETIKEIDRVMDVDRLERIVEAVRRGNNIHLHLDLIAGLPCEDYDSFVRSFNRVYAMRPHQLQLGFLKVLKGSPMEERAEKYGIAFLDRPPYEALFTKWISYPEMRRLKRVERMVEIYHNSGQFAYTIACLERAFPHPFAMYDALADYYEKEGYDLQTPARAYRYEILLAFAEQADERGGNRYRELLTFDYYLRENAKNRPRFARDLTERKDEIRALCRQEGLEKKRMTHLELFDYPVWNMADREEGPCARQQWVLFDYEKRSPFSGEAAFRVINARERGTGGKTT